MSKNAIAPKDIKLRRLIGRLIDAIYDADGNEIVSQQGGMLCDRAYQMLDVLDGNPIGTITGDYQPETGVEGMALIERIAESVNPAIRGKFKVEAIKQ